MNVRLLLFLVIASLLFAACSNSTQPAPAQPTQAAPASPTEAAPDAPTAETPAELDLPAEDTLIAHPWQWAAYTSPVEQFDVAIPVSYTLTFDEDGTVLIVADCNNAQGSYTDEDGALTIAVGPMTAAACPEGSRSDQFVALLGSAARYFFQDGQLFIDLLADGGTMAFAPRLAEADTGAEEPADAGLVLDADTIKVTPPPVLSERARGIVEVPCEVGMPSGPDEVEGETYACGILTAPMRWDDPESPNLDLHYMVLKATGDNPEPDPLVYLAGGPGQSSIIAGSEMYNKVRQSHDIVRLDQRGAGLSQRLSLEECLVLAVQDEEAQDQVAILVAFIQAGNDESAQDATSDLDFDLEVRQLCSRQFTNQGIDLSAFTTAASVRDLVTLIQGLGYQSFNVHGESYGTRLAMTLMAMLPQIEDAPALRSVVLDSTLPPSVYLLSSLPHGDHDPVIQLLEECQQDETCRAAYPNLKARLADLLAQLEAEPLTVDGQTIAVADLAEALTDLSGVRAGFMPLMISELEQGVATTFFALRDKEIGAGDPEGGISLDTSDPVQAFLAGAIKLLGADGEIAPAIEFVVAMSGVFPEDDPLSASQAYIEQTYDGELRDGLLALTTDLTLEDFEKSSYVAQIRQEAAAAAAVELTPEEQAARQLRSQRMLSLSGLSYFLNMNIHCIEDYQFERFEDGINTYNDLELPQVTDLDYTEAQSTTCAGWPVEPGPIEIKNPVSSAVPTLILQGAYDTRTPVYMGRRASRELANSTLVIVPQQGHEVWTSATNCTGQIATAFVLDPEAELDLSCLDARRPQWALPADASAGTPDVAAEPSAGADVIGLLNGAMNGIFQASLYHFATTGNAGPFIDTEMAREAFK